MGFLTARVYERYLKCKWTNWLHFVSKISEPIFVGAWHLLLMTSHDSDGSQSFVKAWCLCCLMNQVQLCVCNLLVLGGAWQMNRLNLEVVPVELMCSGSL